LTGESLSEFTLIHNPTDGIVKDGLETSKDIFRTTAIAKQVAGILYESQKPGSRLHVVAHSQGGRILKAALRYHARNSEIKLTNIRVQFHGGANNRIFTDYWIRRSSAQTFGPRRGYIDDDFDLVPNILGFNTLNPIKIIGSILSAPRLFMNRDSSPHSLPPNCSTQGCTALD